MKKNIYSLVLALFLFSCCKQTIKSGQPDSQNKASIEKNIPAPDQNNLSPGTAMVNALILENFPGDDFVNLKVRINEVSEYGAAFPPLPPGTEIFVGLSKEVFDSVNQIEPIAINKSFYMLLQHQVKISGNDKPIWSVLQIKIKK